MGRGLSGRPVACAAHPHRPAVDRCDDCLGHFCAECLVRAGETLRCRACTDSLPAREAAAAAARRVGPRLRGALRERMVGLALYDFYVDRGVNRPGNTGDSAAWNDIRLRVGGVVP
jgi:hypothetical protein